MSANLIERIKKARQTTVKVGEIIIICRRPTPLERAEMTGGKIMMREVLTKFVDGWENVKEVDLVPGGTGEAVPFSAELFSEWVSDHPESWGVISDAVVQGFKRHEEALELAAKN